MASVVRELKVFEALMCFFTIYTMYNEPLASVNCDSDDDRYDTNVLYYLYPLHVLLEELSYIPSSAQAL